MREGVREAERLASRLEGVRLHALYTSERERSRETAAPLASRQALAPQVSAGVDEIDFGEWTSREFQTLEADPEWSVWNSRRSLARIPGGETIVMAQSRMVAELRRLADRHPEQTVGIVSHWRCHQMRGGKLSWDVARSSGALRDRAQFDKRHSYWRRLGESETHQWNRGVFLELARMPPEKAIAEMRRRVLLISDRPLERHGMAQLINRQPDLVVAAEVDGISPALESIVVEEVDMVVLDLSAGRFSWRRIREDCCGKRKKNCRSWSLGRRLIRHSRFAPSGPERKALLPIART